VESVGPETDAQIELIFFSSLMREPDLSHLASRTRPLPESVNRPLKSAYADLRRGWKRISTRLFSAAASRRSIETECPS
jgi:hypothetical protein